MGEPRFVFSALLLLRCLSREGLVSLALDGTFAGWGALTIDKTAAWWACSAPLAGLSVGGRLGWSRDAPAMGLA